MRVGKITIINNNRICHNYNKNDYSIHKNCVTEVHNYPYHGYKLAFSSNMDFGTYFPTEILGYNEEKFEDLMLNAIKNPNQKAKLMNIIVKSAEKSNKTMEFMNIWKQAVPSIFSQGMFSSCLSGNGTDAFLYKLGFQSIIDASSSSGSKFLNSKYKTDILSKEAKGLTLGSTSGLLFHFANINPEPNSRAALYALSAIIGGIGYIQKNKDSQKIMGKQFVDSIKKLIKLNILDPFEIINCATNNSLKFTDVKIKEYDTWKTQRNLTLRYNRTGTYVNTHNDFDSAESKNVLYKNIKTLKGLGYNEEQITEYLNKMSLVYLSTNETQEAQYLLKVSLDEQKKIFGENSPKLLNTLNMMRIVLTKNEEPLAERNILKHILKINEVNSFNKNEIKNTQKALLLSDIKILPDLVNKKNILEKDLSVSLMQQRKDIITNPLLPIIETNFNDVKKEAISLFDNLKNLNLSKKEYIQYFKEINKFSGKSELKDEEIKFLQELKENEISNEITYKDLEPKDYAKFIQKITMPYAPIEDDLYQACFYEELGKDMKDPEMLKKAIYTYSEKLTQYPIFENRAKMNLAILENKDVCLDNCINIIEKDLSERDKFNLKNEISEVYFLRGKKDFLKLGDLKYLNKSVKNDTNFVCKILNFVLNHSQSKNKKQLIDSFIEVIGENSDNFSINKRSLYQKERLFLDSKFAKRDNSIIDKKLMEIEKNIKILRIK